MNGVLRKSFDINDAKFGKMSMARSENRRLCVLVDFPYQQGKKIMDALDSEVALLPQGVTLKPCHSLPSLITERSGYGDRGGDRDRSYSRGGYSGGGDRRTYSGGGGGGGGRGGGDRYGGGGGGGGRYGGGGGRDGGYRSSSFSSGGGKAWSR